MMASISTTDPVRSDWQEAFLAMLPRIRDAIRVAFCHLPGDHRDEAVQEGVANACVRFARLDVHFVNHSPDLTTLDNPGDL